jgi:hypothetical protein
MRPDLQPEEDAALRVALDQVNEEAGVFEPTLPMVVEALLNPREAMVAGVSAAGASDTTGDVRLGQIELGRPARQSARWRSGSTP